ncbi:MAG: c-type cytochrome [Anaerolineales bacterium]|nr:c-type cytochrome [Anaerolineales bacterium]
MKRLHLSTHCIELLIGVTATAAIAFSLMVYALLEPARIASAQADQLAYVLDDAMTLYAENCIACHGAGGEGVGAMPALAAEGLQSSDATMLTAAIALGRAGTAMPAWSQTAAGPLNDYQVGELVTLIQSGEWQMTAQRVADLGLEPPAMASAAPDPEQLQQLIALPGGEQYVTSLTLYAENCVACHGADAEGTGIAPALNTEAVRAQEQVAIEATIATGVAGTLMAGWENQLTPDEIASLASLIKTWDTLPENSAIAQSTPFTVTPELLALGATTYAASCTFCHGPDGQGTPRAPALNVQSVLTNTNDAALQQIITMGVSGTRMAGWGDLLSEEQIQAMVAFIRAWEPTAPDVAVPLFGNPWLQG